jgi:hypothetical protein
MQGFVTAQRLDPRTGSPGAAAIEPASAKIGVPPRTGILTEIPLKPADSPAGQP